jgi:hypothetical protein
MNATPAMVLVPGRGSVVVKAAGDHSRRPGDCIRDLLVAGVDGLCDAFPGLINLGCQELIARIVLALASAITLRVACVLISFRLQEEAMQVLALLQRDRVAALEMHCHAVDEFVMLRINRRLVKL